MLLQRQLSYDTNKLGFPLPFPTQFKGPTPPGLLVTICRPNPERFSKKMRQKSHKRYNSPICFRRFFVFRCRLLLFFLLVLCDALHLMQRRGRRPIGGLSFPVPERMENTAETSY
jgi:hypothetical protein